MEIEIRKTTGNDCRSIAELALIAGEGIPAYFWGQSLSPGQEVEDVGTQRAASETENFSCRNVYLAVVNGNIAGKILACRLPDSECEEGMEEFPEYIHPLIELELCVQGSFYINMLASYPVYRNEGIGTRLMSVVHEPAINAGCTIISVEVFEQNEGALKL